MDRTAGFAASVVLRQELIQTLVRVLFNAGRVNHTIIATLPQITANLFLTVPELIYSTANGDRLAIDLYAWGPMTITPPGGVPESRRVKFRARVLVPQTVSVMGGQLRFGLSANEAVVAHSEIDPYAGGLFSTAAQDYILSPGFGTLLTLGLQIQLSALGSALPPLDVGFLGALANEPSLRATARVLDGALALGLDIDKTGLVTHGDPSRLIDTTSGCDIGMWTNPVAVPVAYANVRSKIETEVGNQGAHLDQYEIGVEEGWLRVAGKASKTGGSVEFSMHAVPKLVRPGVHYEWDEEYGEHFEYTTPDRDELWFDTQDVHVDVDKDWWVSLLEALGGVLTFGIGALVVESIVDMIRGNVTSGIQSGGNTVAPRDSEFTIPGVTRPSMRMRIATFECHAEGVFAAMSLSASFWAASVRGPSAIAAEHALTDTLRYQVDLPPDVLPDDPELRVRWTIRRVDTNAIVIAQNLGAASGLALEFDNTVVPLMQTDQFTIEVRVYRTLGASNEDFLNRLLTLSVVDSLDRRHPFVRWHHDLFVPRVRVEADGSHTKLGMDIITRHSDIHRTVLPGRCRMAGRYSLTKLVPEPGPTYPLEYLDTLPFPIEELDAHRAKVCDYCFYGGPDKTVPLA
jgi:hypothetical protein